MAQSSTNAGQPIWIGDVAIATQSGDQGIGGDTGPGVAVVSDGAGGAIIAWEDDFDGNIKAQRIDPNGNPLWVRGGIAVAPASGFQMSPRAVSDGAGGMIVAWADGRVSGFCNPGFQGECDIFAQRLRPDGTPLWGAGGVPVTTASGNQGLGGIAIAADGASGALLAWVDPRSGCCSVFAQHMSASGMAMWMADGAQVAPPPLDYFNPPALVTDAAGGALVAWNTGTGIYVQRLGANGSTLFPSGGIPLGIGILRPYLDYQRPIAMIADGSGGAILAGTIIGADT